jgi:hypothetical protein
MWLCRDEAKEQRQIQTVIIHVEIGGFGYVH